MKHLNSKILSRKLHTFLACHVKGTVDYHLKRHFTPLPPTTCMFLVTFRCNGRCVMCNIWQQKVQSELTIQEIEAMLKDPLFRSVTQISLTGGEPTLRNDIYAIAKLIVKHCPNLKVLGLTTNGLIPNRSLESCKAILKACEGTSIGTTVSVSLDGIGKVHDRVRGVKGAFKQTTRTLSLLKQLQKRTQFQFSFNCQATVSKWNLDNIYELERWFETNKINHGFSLADYRKQFHNQDLDFYIETHDKYLKFLSHLKTKGKWNYLYQFVWDRLHNKKRKLLCPFIVEGIIIYPNGEIYYCPETNSIGNTRNEAISHIYYNPENLAYRTDVEKTQCPTCPMTCRLHHSLIKYPLTYLKFRFQG